MTPVEMEAASDLLYRHWREGTRIDALPEDLRPKDRAEGYGVQEKIEKYTALPLFGWKIAATSKAGQAHINVDGPLAGRLLAERVIADGGDCPLGNNLMKVAELEFCFRMGADLAPRAEAYSEDEVMAKVGGLHPAIEIPDSRYNVFEKVGMGQLIADNACAHRFILGPAVTVDWRARDLAAEKPRGFRNGALVETGLGANVLGGPVIAMTWLANELSRLGITLKKDEAVTTGTCIKPAAIAVGDLIEGDFGELGRVSVRIV